MNLPQTRNKLCNLFHSLRHRASYVVTLQLLLYIPIHAFRYHRGYAIQNTIPTQHPFFFRDIHLAILPRKTANTLKQTLMDTPYYTGKKLKRAFSQ